jgi:hypothetical protein
MQAVAAEFPGYAGLFCGFFGEKSSKTACFDSFILKQALKSDAQRLFKSLLARNELVASASARVLRVRGAEQNLVVPLAESSRALS